MALRMVHAANDNCRMTQYERTILLFTIFAILTVAGAVAAMSLRNLVHSVLALTVAFAGLAAVYLQLGAQFLGLAQILVYVGAVAILIVFAILLTRDSGSNVLCQLSAAPGRQAAWWCSPFLGCWPGQLIIALHLDGQHRCRNPKRQCRRSATLLMLRFALPLEVIGLLLTAALIGAVTIAMRREEGDAMTPLASCLLLSALLFAIGLAGALMRT